jgi:long-chain acyl-CoA synthetase
MRIDPNGDTSDDGYPLGEIQVKGYNVMLGYYNNPEATADVFTDDGWFRTGDIGYCDADGYYYITGRSKFVIVLENGKNVFPEEIENYLEGVEGVGESVVLGRKAEGGDEIILTAIVYPDEAVYPKNTETEKIQDEISKRVADLNRTLPSFKQIKKVEIRREEFEKTTSKKIKRHLVK